MGSRVLEQGGVDDPLLAPGPLSFDCWYLVSLTVDGL